MYDFTKLNKEQESKYLTFKQKFCRNDSPLNNEECKSREDNLRNQFENHINALLRELDFVPKSGFEVFKHEVAHKKGRMDCQYGNTIIEYKKYGLLSKPTELKKAQEQIKGYLEGGDFRGFVVYGFLFDGCTIYAYKRGEDGRIFEDKEHSGELTALNFDNLIKTIFMDGVCAISPQNLKKDFGILDKDDHPTNNQEVLALAKHLFNTLQKGVTERTKLILTEWEKLFRLAEGGDHGKHQDIDNRRMAFSRIFGVEIHANNEYKALFALHTTLSIIIKLLLIRIINDKPEVTAKTDLHKLYKTSHLSKLRSFFGEIERGVFFRQIGVANMIDNDFFSWYTQEDFNDEIRTALQTIIFKMCGYASIGIATTSAMLDLFKELYLSFIPKCVRHSFGEYYTPYWLAERTFLLATSNETGSLENRTFIDPNCGSGTFLSVFYNHKRKDSKNIDFKDFVKGVVGVDINPLATLMAKANLLIQGLKTCNFDSAKRYELPIYLADSLYIPQTITIGNTECFDYELYTTGLQEAFNTDKIRICLPKSLVNREGFLEILDEIEACIVKKDRKRALKIFETYLDLNQEKDLKREISKNIDELIRLEEKNLNSIWLRIFANYFRMASYDKFDYIIGNPAWVQWSVLPEAYRNNIKQNMRMDGLFSEDKNVGGNNLNICALIANKCCERWLAPSGNFCFLMPKSILFNKSFQGFRNLIINTNEKLYFNEILDFSRGGEIFEGVGLDFCAFKINRVKNNGVIPFVDFSKNKDLKSKATHNDTWEMAKKYFEETTKVALQLHTSTNNNFLITNSLKKARELKSYLGKCAYKFRKGVSIECLMRLKFIRLDGEDHSLGVFHPYHKVGNRLHPNQDKTIKLELQYIKPFITAPMLIDGGVMFANSYAICPYEPHTKKPMPKEVLQTKAPHIYKYLLSVEHELGKGSNYNKRVQSFDESYGILRMGVYVWGKNFVCIRDNTKLAPNLIQKIKTDWGDEVTPLFDNHISYISQSTDGTEFIHKVEADRILSILKKPEIQEIIMQSQDCRSISSRLPIKLTKKGKLL
ncbi:Eco57I restriction-modification methylase domain-containing protein [Helicobacter ailurogastricus]|uniref:site-specific DNA-methyltransferase (adenine-specific) n=1 Tax=Helicobacter ailurogastricus TaxID=1578720 RepID=A0A0K2XZS9_9HELI|nr:N-6 DNA methylase [Helicobacter ailurogastricus]CRF52606.1 hypothetical protein HAL07_10710 [Helicobacter ailurogastricus]